MTEYPILFNREMILALHSGRKTQTRRIMKIQPPAEDYKLATCVSTTGDQRNEGRQHWIKVDGYSVVDGSQPFFSSPYGEPGDRLWVREAWRVSARYDGLPPRDLPFDRGVTIMYGAGGSRAHNAAGEYENDPCYPLTLPVWAGKGRPSIHMPRVASRTNLEVTGVRVERLQDISEADAEAEGIDFLRHVPDADETLSARDLYRILWDTINEARGFGWNTNPWVWVVEFLSAF